MMMGIMEMVVHMVHSAIPIMIRLEVVIHIQVIIVKERIISVDIVTDEVFHGIDQDRKSVV